MWVVSLKSSTNIEIEIKKNFLSFGFFLRSYRGLQFNVIFGMILFTFNVIFVHIKIFR